MDQAKKGFLPVLQGVRLSKTQCPTTAEDRENMKDVPYASAIGSIMYAMLCTRPDVCLLPLEHCVGFSLEEERVMQQSSVSISLSF